MHQLVAYRTRIKKACGTELRFRSPSYSPWVFWPIWARLTFITLLLRATMTRLFHPLRHRSRVLVNGLLVVLLATWMSTVCQHCLAQAAAAPAASEHCQHDAPPPSDGPTDTQDCCAQAAASLCDGDDCMQVSSVVSSEPLTYIATATPMHALPPSALFSHAYSFIPPPVHALAYAPLTDARPRYLRNCVFRI